MTARAATSRGMTLVEVLIAFAILITGLVCVFGLLTAGMRSHKRAINETDASIVASSIIAEARADLFNDKELRSDGSDFVTSKDFPLYKYNRQVVPLEPVRSGVSSDAANREYFMRVKVRWSEQGEDKLISVDTILFRNRKR